MCFISFIVPVYNLKESEVWKCVDSILQQTDPDYEVVIVDDGSTNGAGDYCDTLASRYGLTVIHQENQGLAVARNTGIAASHGEWIVHVDGDDWVDVHLAEELRRKCSSSRNDIIVWGFILANGARQQELLLKDKKAFDQDFQNIRDNVLCSILGSDQSFASLSLNTSWAKAYRRTFIEKNGLLYNPELRRAQDAVYNLYAFSAADSVGYIDRALNFYRNDNVSLSRGYNPNTFKYLQATALAAKAFCDDHNASSDVRIAVTGFIQHCFRMITEQSFAHRDCGESFPKRRKHFLAAISSEPFNTAFAPGVSRTDLLDVISFKLYQKKCLTGIVLYNELFKLALRLKMKLS